MHSFTSNQGHGITPTFFFLALLSFFTSILFSLPSYHHYQHHHQLPSSFNWSNLTSSSSHTILISSNSHHHDQRQSLFRVTCNNHIYSHHYCTTSILHNLLIQLNFDIWSKSSIELLVRYPQQPGLSSHDIIQLIHQHLVSSTPHVIQFHSPIVLVDTVIYDIQRDILDPELHFRKQRRLQFINNNLSIKQLIYKPDIWFNDYHPLDDIITWYKELANQFPSRVYKFMNNIGTTHEGRNLVAIHITNINSTIPLHDKKQVYIQGGIHAREWISHATTQYITYNLITSNNDYIINLLNQIEFIIIPVVNPDGYVYTWDHDRLWRKNRRDNGNGSYGVDLNRNYDANWGHGGSSGFPSSDTFKGPNVASEPEVKALQDYFNSHTRIVAGLDLHSYSQLILRPIGWDRHDSPHEKQHEDVSNNMAKIIKKVHGKSYTSEKSIDLYATTGSASDYFYLQKFPMSTDDDKVMLDNNNIADGVKYRRPYGLTIELRPSPEWWGPGFVLPNDEIIPTGEEILPAVLKYAETAIKAPLFE